MKYPVIYIKGRGNHTARFTELTEGQMRIAGDIGAAMGKLMPLKDDHAFILYEQQGEEDIRSIRFLRSWFPGAGIILIISGQLTGEERRRCEQRRAGRHIARRFPPHTAIHDRLYVRPQTRRR